MIAHIYKHKFLRKANVTAFVTLWRDSLEVIRPRDISSSAGTARARDHQPTHLDGLGSSLIPFKADNDVVRLLTADRLAGLHAETRAVDTEGELGGVGEHVLEWYTGGGTCFDAVGPLGLGRQAMAE